MLKREWDILRSAVMFLTRIPVGSDLPHDPVLLQQAPRYFPVVGWIVGSLSAVVFLAVNRWLSTHLALLASMITSIWITGAFHEDGFADVCDGFGGGWTKEKILMIMKDSRLGTYGVIGLMAILGTKFLLLDALPKFVPGESRNPLFDYRYFLALIITAHSISRLMPVLIIRFSEYASDPDTSKAKPMASQKPGNLSLIITVVLGLLPFALLPPVFLLSLAPLGYATYSLAKYFRKWIGGYTGDCLGAVQQVCEILFYLAALIIWQYL